MLSHFIDKTLLRFLAVGVLNTLLGMVIMFGLYNLAGASYWLSTAANYILVSIFSFLVNRSFTFHAKGSLVSGGLRFALNIAVCYLLAYGVAKPLIAAVCSGCGKALQENVAMLAGMCFFTGLNYIGQRWFVFGRAKSRELEAGKNEDKSSVRGNSEKVKKS